MNLIRPQDRLLIAGLAILAAEMLLAWKWPSESANGRSV